MSVLGEHPNFINIKTLVTKKPKTKQGLIGAKNARQTNNKPRRCTPGLIFGTLVFSSQDIIYSLFLLGNGIRLALVSDDQTKSKILYILV